MTLTERFEARLSQFVASAGDDIILQTTPSDAAAVARQVERYVRAVCSEETRAEVLEHPAIVELWPALRDTGIVDLSPLGVGRPLRPRVLSARMGDGAWPLDVAPIDVIRALERIDDTEANLAAVSLREERTVYPGTPGAPGENSRGNASSYLAKLREVAVKGGAKAPALELHKGGKLDDDARLAEANAVGEWWPLAIAIVLHVERLVREPGALYAARRARKLVRERYGVHLAGLVRDAILADERTREACEELERATRAALERFTERLGADPATDAEALAERDGVLELDARFADFLAETCGEPGKENAKLVRERGAERIAAYQRDRNAAALWAPWKRARATMLAFALWQSSVREVVERARQKPPALVRGVHTSALEFHSRLPKFDPDSRALSFDGRKLAEFYGASFDLGVIERGLSLLGSVAAHRLLRWEVTTGHDRAIRGDPYANILDVEGGWTALARLLDLNPDKPKVTSDLRAIVHAQAHFRFAFPDGSHGNMLSYTEKAAEGRNARARITIALGAPLLPGYVHGLTGAERKLVPLLREPPPLYGRPNEHGQQMTMSLAVMAEFRERARELASNGSVRLTHDDWTRLADRSGVPRRLARPVVDCWLAGDTLAAPFLKQPDRDLYTLGDAHGQERAFLEEAGRTEASASAAGKKGTAKRKANIARGGRQVRRKAT